MGCLWQYVVFIFLFVPAIHTARTVYNFEDASQLWAFNASSTSTLTLSRTRYKDGMHSMKWNWTSGDELTHSFTSNPINRKEIRKGGIKVWIYNTYERVGESLKVSFDNSQSTVSQFNISLNFKGWRAIWVQYKEALLTGEDKITSMRITAPKTNRRIYPLYIDLLRLVEKLTKHTRDKIVPTIGQGLYTRNNLWQQTYRWSQAVPTAIMEPTPHKNKLADLNLIEKRLDSWFVLQSQSTVKFTGNIKRRWDALNCDVDTANTELAALNITRSQDGVITGTPLYATWTEFKGKEKFGYVMKKVLFPLALDYHIRSRDNEVDAVAATELLNLNNGNDSMNAAIQRISGSDLVLQETFVDALGSTMPYTEMKVKEAINTLNNNRKERLMLLLDYTEDQGFTDGSAIGTLHHEMNHAGAGFMNAVYVLRQMLQDDRKQASYVATMKWYTDFGEIYQNPFEYTGTTADRMRTISLWRLFAVLMMPSSTTEEKQVKIRDMEALGRWYANALSPNEGFAGLLKPDYLSFHHNSFYASAYTPDALHNAALIQYLLSGTSFALGSETRGHIRKGLEIMRIVSVKYSTPNSVSGRFPEFNSTTLVRCIPAYAYISVTAPNTTMDGSLGDISSVNTETVKLFLRLYNTDKNVVMHYLGNQTTYFNGILYLNSIGSINIMEEINRTATDMSIETEGSPKGFWALNYAALVIHRREDWAVSVKGFNKYVWDTESPWYNNVFGLYQSHGALLVANSEVALQTYDIDNGWDWTRPPGTTTIKMDFDQLVTKSERHYQPMELAGGVRLVGSGEYPTGVFGMDFSQPPYRWETGAFQANINFAFKKSVFFADFVIICLGSSITSFNSSPNTTQTTLFQNKLVDVINPSSIYVNATAHSLSTDLIIEPTFFGTGNDAATLMDVNGNGYYIPNGTEQGLNVAISRQTSRNHRRPTKETSARYATAWLNHGVDPSNKGYEYAILVNKPLTSIQGNLSGVNTELENAKIFSRLIFGRWEFFTSRYCPAILLTTVSSAAFSATVFRQPQPSDKCFSCGQFGHRANSPFCPNYSRLYSNRALPSTSSVTASK